ncbi:conserved hypothetical protein [Anaeromyxobacter dehalogenans 2CP-1]|uniref:BP74 N-terminal domain-containing protein n=1 Tax=Anaeromyxobacter dehalogenans (strain ATCC BAA-258 / DSM 21875 / 2CP-1) TaxID=455488 RepID=B8JEE0_ANAD2|nr:hypothetical protein [Anaeromyxobacter dehalogenans]ACL64266.1 conserved hypothetical protein [Anaeromyxobacter dehalogenans 2CP-1]
MHGARWGVIAAVLAASGCFDTEPCPAPLEACGGICYDLRTDRLHCGDCGNACGGGEVCLSGACVSDPNAACVSRSGGAFVTLGVCGDTVKAWIVAPDFISRAEALVADPSSPGASVPTFDLRDGSDCDAQWSWSPSPATARFADAAAASCSACPSSVQADPAGWIAQVGVWCPPARVLAVHRQ